MQDKYIQNRGVWFWMQDRYTQIRGVWSWMQDRYTRIRGVWSYMQDRTSWIHVVGFCPQNKMIEKEKVATESLEDLDCDLIIILAFEPQITSWQNS